MVDPETTIKLQNDTESISLALREQGYEFIVYYTREGAHRNVSDSYLLNPTTVKMFSLHTFSFLKTYSATGGYHCMTLCHKDHQLTRQVHKLLWEHVNGPAPKGMQVDHINDDRTDNRLENLQLLTPAENSRKARLHTGKKLDQIVLAKNLETKEIRRFESISSCGRSLGINVGAISLIVHGKQRTARCKDNEKWTFYKVQDDGAPLVVLPDGRKSRKPVNVTLKAMDHRIRKFKKKVQPITIKTYDIAGDDIVPPRRRCKPFTGRSVVNSLS